MPTSAGPRDTIYNRLFLKTPNPSHHRYLRVGDPKKSKIITYYKTTKQKKWRWIEEEISRQEGGQLLVSPLDRRQPSYPYEGDALTPRALVSILQVVIDDKLSDKGKSLSDEARQKTSQAQDLKIRWGLTKQELDTARQWLNNSPGIRRRLLTQAHTLDATIELAVNIRMAERDKLYGTFKKFLITFLVNLDSQGAIARQSAVNYIKNLQTDQTPRAQETIRAILDDRSKLRSGERQSTTSPMRKVLKAINDEDLEKRLTATLSRVMSELTCGIVDPPYRSLYSVLDKATRPDA